MSPKEHLNRIRKIVDENAGGHRDDNLRRTIFDEVRAIQALELGGDFNEKLGEVLDYTDIYFSEEKYHRQNGGLPQVSLLIRQALDKIESHLPAEGPIPKP